MKTKLEKALIEQALYFRIGTKYWGLVYQSLINSEGRIILTPWNKTTLIDDYGRKFLDGVPKYNHVEHDVTDYRHEDVFYFSDFVKHREPVPHRKTPKTIFVLDNEERFRRHVSIEDLIERQHEFKK